MQSLKSQIRLCSRVQRAVIGVIVGVLVLFYVVAYGPAQSRLASLRSQINEGEAQLLARQSQTKDLPAIAAEVARLRHRLDQYKALPDEQDLAQFIRDMDGLSKQASLRNFGYTPQTLTRQTLFCETPIRFDFDGDFLDVYSFLRQVEQMPRLTRVRSMSLKPMRSTASRPGQVQVQLQMNIYSAAN